jgi:hypothetical protein
MKKGRVGIFNQPIVPNSDQGDDAEPWDFKPSDYDQRAYPSAASGDYYGTGFKAKVGTIRDTSTPGMMPVSPKQLGTPPKSLA